MTTLVLSPDAASRGYRFTRERIFDWQAVKPMKRATLFRRKDLSISPSTKVSGGFVATNPPGGAGSFKFFSAESDRPFFWGVEPRIDAALVMPCLHSKETNATTRGRRCGPTRSGR
jgi:hypothetical protein